ncbi:MAG: hypothetical protein ACREMO_01270 [Gemmatimonadales bacterium]
MKPLRISLILALAALASCSPDSSGKLPKVSEALPELPLPPNPKLVSKSGGEDVLQITVSTPIAPEQAAAYYRRILGQGIWRLVADSKTPDHGFSLYAERAGPPLWVTIRPAADGPGSLVDLTGALVDSARVKADTVKARADSAKVRKATGAS